MAQLLILTSSADTDVLPALGLLSHRTRHIQADAASLVNAPAADLVLVDARRDLASASAAVKAAQAEAHAARVELAVAHSKAARLDKLAKASDSVSEEELETVHSAENLARAKQDSARARVAESIAAVDKLRNLLETTAITSF